MTLHEINYMFETTEGFGDFFGYEHCPYSADLKLREWHRRARKGFRASAPSDAVCENAIAYYTMIKLHGAHR